MKTKFLLFFIFCFQLGILSAQSTSEFGVRMGVAHYFGDLNNDYSLKDPGFAAGILYRKNFNHRISFRAGASYFKATGSDSDSNNSFEQMRNLHFNSNVIEGFAGFEFNFMPYIHGSSDNYYTPYVFGGIGITRFNPKTKINDQTYSLYEFGTEGQTAGDEYFRVAANLNFGVGWKMSLTRDWSINVEMAFSRLTTDYFDDVSGVYPNLSQLEIQRGETAVALSDRSGIEGFATTNGQRGNAKNNDSYVILQFSLMKFFGQLQCPATSKYY